MVVFVLSKRLKVKTVGLISSLATYAMVNDLGFIETAYRPVVESKIKDDVVFFDAFQEEEIPYSTSLMPAKDAKSLKDDKTFCSLSKDGIIYMLMQIILIYIDLSPKQLVSVSSALIPFLEHDDATRALMGSKMQRQAVPLIRMQASKPLVGTGMMSTKSAKSIGLRLLQQGVMVLLNMHRQKRLLFVQTSKSLRRLMIGSLKVIDIYYLT